MELLEAKPCSLRHIDRHGRKPLKECLPASSWSRFESPSGHAGSELFFRDEKLQLLARRDEAILSGRPAAEVERRGIGRLQLREILLEGLIDMGSCALHDRLEPAEPHPDQFPNTGLSIRPFVDHREPLRLVRAQRQNDPSSGF